MKVKRAIVLGGTEPHIHLINRLKQRGYYTVLVDYTENPPAKQYADVHIKESTLDIDAVLRIATENQADLIISACIDQVNLTACIVAEKLGLSTPYSSEVALNVTRKDKMKKIFCDNGICTSEFYRVTEENYKCIHIQYPAVVKPVDCNSSKGVFKVENDEEYENRVLDALRLSRTHTGVVERFVEGTEIQVDCVAVNSKAYVLMTRDKKKTVDDADELQVGGFSVPGRVSEGLAKNISIIAQQIVDAFGIDNTPFFFQAIVDNNQIYVLEFAPRVAGGTTYDLISKYSGVDILDVTIDSFTKCPIRINPSDSKLHFCSRFLYMNPGVFDHVEGINNLLSDGTVDYYYEFILKGREISSSLNSGNRVAAVVTKSDNWQEAEKRMAEAIGRLKVIDKDGVDRTKNV